MEVANSVDKIFRSVQIINFGDTCVRMYVCMYVLTLARRHYIYLTCDTTLYLRFESSPAIRIPENWKRQTGAR